MKADFRALRAVDAGNGEFTQHIQDMSFADLPDHEVLIRVHYSSLNYKDALSANGHKGVTRHYPHTPGIDAVGVVEASEVAELSVGTEVLVMGYDLGMNTPGGYGQYIRVPAAWVIRKPHGLTEIDAMALGTAGFTAALSVEKLINNGLKTDQGEVLVTGATGGVGMIAVALLAQLGFTVVASTGKTDQSNILTDLGAVQVLDRDFLLDDTRKALLKERWAGVVDTVGGEPLFAAIRSLQYGASATTCGLVAGPTFAASVFPFILRGVNLLGVDSVELPLPEKQRLWNRLASEWKLKTLPSFTHPISLEELPAAIERMSHGKMIGRTVVDLR